LIGRSGGGCSRQRTRSRTYNRFCPRPEGQLQKGDGQ
jgi:hypothetical protein